MTLAIDSPQKDAWVVARPVRRSRAFIAFLGMISTLTCAATAQPLGSAVAPTVDNPNRFAVTGAPATQRFLRMAAKRRVDLCIIGDSNTRQIQITGHEDGMGRAFAARFGMYATRVDPFAGQGSWGAGVLSSFSIAGAPFRTVGEPESVDPYVFDLPQLPSSLGVLAAGEALYTTYNYGFGVLSDNPVDITAPLRYHLTDFPMVGGSYVFTVRAAFPGDAFVNILSVRPTPPVGGIGPRDFSFDVPSGARPATGLLFCPADAANSAASAGPLVISYNRLENLSRPQGIAYSPMWFEGGQGARRALEILTSTPRNLTAMAEWMRQATRIQNNEGVLLVHIMEGGNDAGDGLPSLGPIGGLVSYTAEGHEDNIRGIILWLRGVWVNAGHDPSSLFFLLGPYHPRGDRLDKQHGFEQAWRNIALEDPQVFTLAGTMLSTVDEFVIKGFNRSAEDQAHLSISGYWGWGTATVRALCRAACPGDFDENGTLSVLDVFAFLNAWFAGDIGTDFNYSGGLEIQDLFDFLNAWFLGCP